MYFKSPLKRISHNSKIYTIKKYAVGCLQKNTLLKDKQLLLDICQWRKIL